LTQFLNPLLAIWPGASKLGTGNYGVLLFLPGQTLTCLDSARLSRTEGRKVGQASSRSLLLPHPTLSVHGKGWISLDSADFGPWTSDLGLFPPRAHHHVFTISYCRFSACQYFSFCPLGSAPSARHSFSEGGAPGAAADASSAATSASARAGRRHFFPAQSLKPKACFASYVKDHSRMA